MTELLFVAGGGAVGALCRFQISAWASKRWQDFPMGTLIVNVTGSFLMGLLAVLTLQAVVVNSAWHYRLAESFLGALTTFSTFSIETFKLCKQGQCWTAFLNVLASMVLCLSGVTVGYLL